MVWHMLFYLVYMRHINPTGKHRSEKEDGTKQSYEKNRNISTYFISAFA